jgi:sugar-specific transcriptional regulator TrmB
MDGEKLESSVLGILTEELGQFGLTRQEATIYLCLLQNKEMSGYEVSKITGISRSNVYSALAGLVEEGAAYLLEGNPNKYTAVSADVFCENRIRRLKSIKTEIVSKIPHISEECEGYITISSHRHIMDKIYNMLEAVEYRIYISMPRQYLEQFRPQLEKLVETKKKVVLLINEPLEKDIKGAITYITGKNDNQLKLIVDSGFVLTGDMTGDASDTCLYCGQKNFVNVFKDSLRNEIKLIELTKGEGLK